MGDIADLPGRDASLYDGEVTPDLLREYLSETGSNPVL